MDRCTLALFGIAAALLRIDPQLSPPRAHGAVPPPPAAAPSLPSGGASPEAPVSGTFLRSPDVSSTQLVFIRDGSLWIAPRAGGLARRLTEPDGHASCPRFSPDGREIAFTGSFDGNENLYTIPVSGGTVTRVTHHPEGQWLDDWAPGGELLFHTSGFSYFRQVQYFKVSPHGGLPARIPGPFGGFPQRPDAAVSPDGRWLAHTPYIGDYLDNWKRYRGGAAPDVWLFDLRTRKSRRVTFWPGIDACPMWKGRTLYYLSDAGPERRLNLWRFEPDTGARKQVTHLTEWDVRNPAVGPGPSGGGEIVFEYGPVLRLLDLATERVRTVRVWLPSELRSPAYENVDASEAIAAYGVSPNGDRMVLEARGDIWIATGDGHPVRNLTQTPGATERDPVWSPDGHSIAYFSDATGEYELWLAPADGVGPPRRLTWNGTCYRYRPHWSPNSREIAFSDKTGVIWLHSIHEGKTVRIDRDPWAATNYSGTADQMSWSADSSCLAYVKQQAARRGAIWLYSLTSGKKERLTSGYYADGWPTFDRSGNTLFFVSHRDFTWPTLGDSNGDVTRSFAYAQTQVILSIPLHPSASPSLLLPVGDSLEQSRAPGALPPSPIPSEAWARRIPVPSGRFLRLAAGASGQLLYLRNELPDRYGVRLYDPQAGHGETTLLDGVDDFRTSADGRRLLARQGGRFALVDARSGTGGATWFSIRPMAARIHVQEEWQELFRDSWRAFRDYLYDSHMRGVDWRFERQRYARLLDSCQRREDVYYVIQEMAAELGVSHAYAVAPPRTASTPPRVSIGMLGVDFERCGPVYRFRRVYDGAPWDDDARGPLRRPGGEVRPGEYLLAVNDLPLRTDRDPWSAFMGLAGQEVVLTVGAAPRFDRSARKVTVRPDSSELYLRYRAWVEGNRSYVQRHSGGRVGYVYVPDTALTGYAEFPRQYYPQADRDALIVDARWNGGGDQGDRFLALLSRPVTNRFSVRDSQSWHWPYDAHSGPKCLLINAFALSGGDHIAYGFRAAGLGPLIGTRTYGKANGQIGSLYTLLDGGKLVVPDVGFLSVGGYPEVEGHGVSPDIMVPDDPARLTDGGDPQLDRAIAEMMAALRRKHTGSAVRPHIPSGPGRQER